MESNQNIAKVTSVIEDPSRSAMLINLLSRKALTSSELARAARITPQEANSHLTVMVEEGLLVCKSYGRHQYYQLANPYIEQVLNNITPHAPIRPMSDKLKAIRFARTCYDHLAGEVGVTLTDKMLERGLLKEEAQDFIVTPTGAKWFNSFGIDLDSIQGGRRHFARQCLDSTERRNHVAGALGAAVTERLFRLGWIERIPDGRAIRVTDSGFRGLKEEFDVAFDNQTSKD